MKRLFGILAIFLFLCLNINARAKYSNYVQAGGKSVKTSSITTYLLMETFPASTITVYLTGTTTLAAIYSNSSGTVKSNPFTADSKAYYEFYADNGLYDVKFSGTGIATPWTNSNIVLSDSADTYNPLSFGAKCNNSTIDTAAFITLLSVIALQNATIEIPRLGPCIIGNLTFPSNVTLDFSSGGGLSIVNSNTVTINGTMFGPSVKRFYNVSSGQGTITISSPNLKTIYAVWFGIFVGNSAAINYNLITPLIANSNGAAIIWPTGTIQIDNEISPAGNSRWISESKVHPFPTFGTSFQQTDATKRILNITVDLVTFEGIKFDGNHNTTDVVLVNSPSTGTVIFRDCTFTGEFSTDITKAALNISGTSPILVQIENCMFYSNGGSGLRLGNISNVTRMVGGSVTSCATTGTAGTAGIVLDSGRTSEIDGVAVEANGLNATTTYGILINAASLVKLRVHMEVNNNAEIAVSNTAQDIDIQDSYFLSTGQATNAILLSGGQSNVRITGSQSAGHTNFISSTGTIQKLKVNNNTTTDTNYFLQKSFDSLNSRQWAIGDIESSPNNLIRSDATAGWVITAAGGSIWTQSISALLDNRSTIVMNKVGANNCFGTYTIDLTKNKYLLGKWVTASMLTSTSSGVDKNASYTLTDGTTTATAQFTAGANFNWTRLGGAIKIDAAATSLILTVSPVESGVDIYAGQISLQMGLNTLNVLGPAANFLAGTFNGEGAALTISSNTIAPTNQIHQVGAGLIKTITVPSTFSSGSIYLVPTAAFTYDATGNVLGTGTAVIGRTMIATYSSSTGKWSMSY